MDSLEFARTARPDAELALRPRSFLFLGGPLSRFFEHLARALIARGHRAHKVNLHLGEQLYWRLPATNYRGRLADWRDFIAGVLDSRQVTDLIFVGDRRPYHLVAAEEARARGIAVICTDFGYLRPDWITVEYDGTTTLSRFPRDPDAIRALAAEQPEPDLRPQFLTPFRLVAALDVGFTVPQVLGRVLYPHYRWHGIYHPFAEYAGWLVALARRRLGAADRRGLRRAAIAARLLFRLSAAARHRLPDPRPFAIRRYPRCGARGRPLLRRERQRAAAGGRRPSARQRADRLAPAGGARNARPPARRPSRRHRRRHPGRIAEQCRRRGDDQQHCRHHRAVSPPAGQGARQRHLRHSRADR